MSENLPSNTIDKLHIEVSQIITKARNTVYKTVNTEMVKAYWEIGKKIVEVDQKGEQRAEYGKEIVKTLAKRLKDNGGSFSQRNLWFMVQFYKSFSNVNAVRSELSWTHYRLLLKITNEKERVFYLEESISENWSTRTLERQINSFYHQRLLATQKENRGLIKQEAFENKEELQASDFIKDPYVLEFTGLKQNNKFYEKDLEQAIIDKLQDFLLELGKGFAFVGRQHRISLEHEHFYIDLVFYNYILKCFLLVDLKTGKLSHQDLGQMDTYVRIFDETIKQPTDNPTIGLVLCSEKNRALAKYSLLKNNKQIFASKYFTQLPTIEELQAEIERERNLIEMEHNFKEEE
jgi:predicted nuclease of restriction endonuclease-like (RecB) superfamily